MKNKKHLSAGPPRYIIHVDLVSYLFMLLLSVVCLTISYSNTTEFVNEKELGEAIVQFKSVVCMVLFFVSILFALRSFFGVWRNVKMMLTPEFEQQGSSDIVDINDFVYNFTRNTVTYGQKINWFINVLFGSRAMYLTPRGFKVLLKWKSGLVLKLGLATIFSLLFLSMLLESQLLESFSFGQILFWSMPVFILLVMLVSISIVDIFLGRSQIPDSLPELSTSTGRESFQGFGHPSRVFHHAPEKMQELWSSEHQIRVSEIGKDLNSTPLTDIAKFNGGLLLESQPLPVDDDFHPSGRNSFFYAHFLMNGTLLLMIHYAMTSYWLDMPKEAAALIWLSNFGAIVFTLLYLFMKTIKLKSLFKYLKNYRKFRSDVLYVYLDGEMSKANITVGKSMNDSIESQNVVTRSNFEARVWAAHLITESYVPRESRSVLSFTDTDTSREWIYELFSYLHSLKEDRAKVVGIDLGQANLQEMLSMNQRIHAMKHTHSLQSSENNKIIEEQETVALPSNSDLYMECPECAEDIKKKAKVCRFCGFKLETNDGL